MKKSELKTGMVLVFDNGDRAVVLRGTVNGDIISGDTWFPLNSPTFTDDLSSYRCQVVEVWQPESNMDYRVGYSLKTDNVVVSGHKCIWKRKSAKQSKIEELEQRQREIADELRALRESDE